MSTNLATLSEIRHTLRYRKDLGLLFDPKSGTFHRLKNAVSRQMVSLIYEGKTSDDIAELVAKQYGVNQSRVEHDIDDLCARLTDFNTPRSNHQHGTSLVEIDKRFDSALDFPLRLEIELTAVCNWNCGFCYNVWKIDPEMSDAEVRRAVRDLPTKHLPLDRAKRILDECAANGCFVVRYSGGETLIHPDALELFEYGGSLGLYQVVFTNGHFITPDIARRMSESNVRCALVSIHGDRDTHNSLAGHPQAYDRATRAMKVLNQAGINVVAELTLVSENVPAVLDVIRDVYQIGVREFGVMRYVPTGRGDEHYGVPIGVTLPLIEQIDRLTEDECHGMSVAWPCAQKLCTSADDSPIRSDDPTLALRFSQLVGHCESGLVWASVSHDGRLRNCPHSNVYFGEVGTNDAAIGNSWPALTAAVEEALTPRATCSGCSVADVCRGGCHLGSFFDIGGRKNLLALPTYRAESPA